MATCQTCRGERYVPYTAIDAAGPFDRPNPAVKVPCPRCNGWGAEHCCDGEDKWQAPTVLDVTRVTRPEAERIARDIDPAAGGFFHNMLVRAALSGAELQRAKTKGDRS